MGLPGRNERCTRRSHRPVLSDGLDLVALVVLTAVALISERRPKADRARLARLRAVAEAANGDGRPWVWRPGRRTPGYPQTIFRQGTGVLVAECFTGPSHPPAEAEFITTFDPPTVLELLAALR